MNYLRTSLGSLECETPVVNRVNLQNKIQGLKILDYLLKDSKMFIITYVICGATYPRDLSTYAVHEIWHKKLTAEMCVVYAVPKPVKIKPTITMLPTQMWNGKIFSAGGDYWSYSISGCVHKLQEWKSRHLSGAKLVAPVVSVGEPELLRDTLSSDVWFTDVQVPYVLPPHALPVGQAGLFSQLAGRWHQPIAQLPPSTVIREKDLSTGARFTEVPWNDPPILGRVSRSYSAAEKAGMLQRTDVGKTKPIHLRYTAEHSNYRCGVQHACLFAALYHTLHNSLQESVLPLICS